MKRKTHDNDDEKGPPHRYFWHATNRPCLLMTLSADEPHTTMDAVRSVSTQARSAGGATHASCFVALGGGVIGTIAGKEHVAYVAQYSSET
jgi:3-dehydroquinate synthetase